MNPAVIIALIAAFLGPLVTYLVTARKFSGTITTSAAEDLWAESKSIRQDYQRRIEELNHVVASCQKRIGILEKRNDELYLENGNLKRMIEQHEETISELRSLVHDLSDENKALKLENTNLKARVLELEEVNNGRT